MPRKQPPATRPDAAAAASMAAPRRPTPEAEDDLLSNPPLGASSVMGLIKSWHDRAIAAEAALQALTRPADR